MKKGRIILLTVVCLLVLTSVAYAASYNVTVPVLGSSYTSSLTKQVTGSAATLHSTNVGADYKFQCRQYDLAGHAGDLVTGIDDGWDGYIDGSSEHTAGESVRLRFAVDGGALVSVNGYGTWYSN